ncbi:uncharacterized protein LOC131022419 isoform X2 [Salvia miltiorrhiza]|nr:uncharacterized protein LOC131022419 isoform X2 [Salvia miltiorrhiza]
MENIHLDAYLTVLYTSSEMAGLRSFKRRVTITSTSFMATIFRMWMKYNREEDTPESSTQNELQIANEDLFEMSQFIIGEEPSWGHVKPWHDYDKVIAIANILNHWITLCINLKETCVIVYGSQQHVWNKQDYEISKQNKVLLARLLPHVLEYAGFFDARKYVTKSLNQWKIDHPEEVNIYELTDDVNCGPFALKFAEVILTGKWEHGFDTKSLKKYMHDMAMNVYGFSTNFD